MKLKNALFAVSALSLMGGLGLLWLAPERLTQAPDISLTTLQGKALSIPKPRGGPVLVSFWATTCAGCLEEIPHLIKLYQDLSPAGFEVIGIAMAYDPPNRVIALSKAKQIPYPIALPYRAGYTGRCRKGFWQCQPHTLVFFDRAGRPHHLSENR